MYLALRRAPTWASLACALVASCANAQTITLDPKQALVITAGNSIALPQAPGSFTFSASGNPDYGAGGYGSAMVVYRDAAQNSLVGRVPVGGSASITGSHFFAAMITDAQGQAADNTGTLSITMGAQTFGPFDTKNAAQIHSGNAAIFASPLGAYRVSTTGSATYGPEGFHIGELMVKYIDPAGRMQFDGVPVGGFEDYIGSDFAVFFSDPIPGDNAGSVAVTLSPIPEPASVGLIAPAILARRRRRD